MTEPRAVGVALLFFDVLRFVFRRNKLTVSMFLQLQRILTLLLVLMTQAFDSSLPQAPFFIDSEVTESQESSTKKLALLVPNNQTTS